MRIDFYDTTLRDGAQSEDISFSLLDKLRITEKLDEFGMDFVEGGWPGSNPKDLKYFGEVKKLTSKAHEDRGFLQHNTVGCKARRGRKHDSRFGGRHPPRGGGR